MLYDEVPRVRDQLQTVAHPSAVHAGRDVEALVEQDDAAKDAVFWSEVPEAGLLDEEPPVAPLAPHDVRAEVAAANAATSCEAATAVEAGLAGTG